jgi:hypothetical protein
VLQGRSAGTPRHHLGDALGIGAGLQDDICLVLGEDASGGPQPLHDVYP